MKPLIKLISVLLWLTWICHSNGLQNFIQQPPISPVLIGNNELMKNFNAQSPNFEAMPPFPPDYPMPGFPVRGIPFEPNDFNLQYQQQYMPPIHLDIQFMPPPVYRFDATRPFMPIPSPMSAPYPFVLPPLADKNKTTSLTVPTTTITSEGIVNEDDATKNKTRRSVGYRFAPRFYVVEDTETNVIDTWKDSNDYRYFSNRWSMGNGPKTRINFLKKDNLKQYKNKLVKSAPNLWMKNEMEKGSELPKPLKNMVRIIPLKREILREVTAKLKELKERGKLLSPFVEKLFKYEYDKRSTISKIVDIRTPLNEDRKKIV